MRRKMFVSVLALGLVLGACSGDDAGPEAVTPTPDDGATVMATDDSTPPAATTEDTATPSEDEAAVIEAFEAVVGACGDRDRDRLRDLSGDAVGDEVRDRDRDQLFGGDDERFTVVSRTVEVDADTAVVTVLFEVTDDDDDVTEVERAWLFERAEDGSWVLAEIPDCPYADD